MENKVIVMTPEELARLIESLTQGGKGEAPKQEPKRYVYGLRGIRDLFNVSHVTAQRYKNTFLKPAVLQRGRKIMIDADLAISLYNQFKTA